MSQDKELKDEANNTVIPETIGISLLLFLFDIYIIKSPQKNLIDSVVIAFAITLFCTPLIYYLKFKSQLKKLSDYRNSVNEAYEKIGQNGFSKLMALCIDNKLDDIKKIIENGENVNLQDAKGYTALMYASSFGTKDAVELLLANGADKLLKSINGNDALFFATKNKHKKIIHLLK